MKNNEDKITFNEFLKLLEKIYVEEPPPENLIESLKRRHRNVDSPFNPHNRIMAEPTLGWYRKILESGVNPQLIKMDSSNVPEPVKDSDKTLNWLLFFSALVMPDAMRDAAIGDLEERYNRRKSKFGSLRAKCFIAFDVLRSIVPIIFYFIVRIFKCVGLYKIIKMFFG